MTTKILKSTYKARKWSIGAEKQFKRYNVLVAHRYCGKSHFCVNYIIKRAIENPNKHAKYAYLSPILKQTKRNVWDIFKQYLEHFPVGSVTFNQSDLSIRLPTGQTIYLLGADDPHSLRGAHLSGVVLDEVAQMPNNIWTEIIYPTLQANKGWVVCIGTPRGKNLFYDLYTRGLDGHKNQKDDWASIVLTAENSGVMTESERNAHLEEMGDELYQQEMMCNFAAADKGAFYGRTLNKLIEDGRVVTDLYNPKLKVIVSWDIGVSDSTALWFAQVDGESVNIIDYYENSDITELNHYIDVCKDKAYDYDYFILPHDTEQRRLGMGKTVFEQMQLAGYRVRPAVRIGKMEGINNVRYILDRCKFDEYRTAYGLQCLMNYRAKYNERAGVMQQEAIHDKTSHAADAFRYLANGIRNTAVIKDTKHKDDEFWFGHSKSDTVGDYDIFGT